MPSEGLGGQPQARAYEPVPPEELQRVRRELDGISRQVEERLKVRLTVDEPNSAVVIEPIAQQGAANVLKAKDLVKAIVVGFPAAEAAELMDEDVILVVIDISSALDGKENHVRRVLGRIIGENGRAKRSIEEMVGVKIAVNNSGLVGIIGDYERAMIARHGIEMLVEGRMHGTVYRRLEQMMRELKRRESTELWYK